ncbi:MAG: glycosyltransferase family 2 protein [Ghiorsea sp.]|nr:glycosyltransferase family 2 protein [Ghiorsea sp.]
MSKISVVLATFNEENNIGDCLKTIKDWADEIIVVDGESTDRTVEIAKKHGAKVFITSNKPIFHINKQMAIDKAKGDWILQLDADERVTPELRDEILKITKINHQPSTINHQPIIPCNLWLPFFKVTTEESKLFQ